jgi:Flp pilus assembly protein TadD
VKRGATLLVTAAGLAIAAGCSQTGTLEIRSRPTAVAAGNHSVSERIAEARGQFALGNVALALELYRKAARENPQSVDALTGMAACYDQMGRFELSRAKYEAALALAPTDPALLGLLAGSLRQQGKLADAAQIQREIAALTRPANAPAASVTAAAPVVEAAPSPVTEQIAANAAAPADGGVPARPETPAIVAPQPVATASLAATRSDSAPAMRLERLSMAEVALVTTRRVDPMVVSASASTIGLAPLAALAPAGVRILNAARIDRLAARTRDWLVERGWPSLAVADAAAVRPNSVIYYPANKLALAQRLSFEFGFATEERSGDREVTVVLGRDVANNARSLTGAIAVSPGPAPFLKAGGAASAAWAPIARQASHAIDAGRTDQAQAMIGRAVIAGAPPLVTSRLVADLTFKTGDHATAAGLYEALMKVWPDDIVMVERAGMARLHLRQYAAAAALLESATSDPRASWQAWNARGVAADAHRDWDTADMAYRHALLLAPRRGEIVNNLGWSMALRGRWGEARELFGQAVALEPRLERAARNHELAQSALDQQLPRRGAAESNLVWAAKLNDAGVVARQQGNVRKAIAAFARAIETRSQWFERAVNNLKLAERKD